MTVKLLLFFVLVDPIFSINNKNTFQPSCVVERRISRGLVPSV